MGKAKESVISFIFDLLRADATLKALFDDSVVKLYNTWSVADQDRYIVHRIDGINDELGFFRGSYYIDFFDEDSDKTTVNNIASRVEDLLEQLGFDTVSEDAVTVRLYKEFDADVETKEDREQHITMRFRIEYFEKNKVILVRSR